MISNNCCIDKTAIVADSAIVEPNVYIGKNCIIGENVRIGFGAVIESNTEIGEGTVISPNAHLGGAPQDISYRGEDTKLIIGKNCIIREFSFLHRASTKEEWKTVVGDNCYIMASSHVAHDCVIGNGVILTSFAGLGGHVHIGDNAIIGGAAIIHQFVRVGGMSMVGAATKIVKDVPPFALVDGNPSVLYGPNMIGLKRRGISVDVRNEIKRAYKILTNMDFLMDQIVEEVSKLKQYDEVKVFLDFIVKSKRGIMRRGE
ncbi:MAG: acyl-ACP--UDP-N-acetylglucosamine O-acyltransferase [Calditerrivibrio sp.]|nr:acyl-ACP--UDP-N-acetylglucosamine O-acyltransferase [Calditerrivibrio sp.]MCA1933223.1 acyl-ACP--UDP-N-acetylglucosamine O-acyltransferase [Calditerrivibrio sp.]MCA1980303.1 acyl-ACP--UDP-N-acetylglucosamine O-acyltransferase [Calditerrivibrio sp.]